ncbi:hypothetical protein Bca101_021590 [Brassica carinata]
MSSMVNKAGNKFTWVIKDFSSLQSRIIYSDGFLIGGYKWLLLAIPKRTKDYVSMFLGVADYKPMSLGWKRDAKISLKVKKPLCFLKDLPLAKLNAKDGGFLVNGELKIVAEVNVLEVIGKSDDASEGSEEDVQPKKKTKMNDCGTGSSDLHNQETRVGNETVDVNGFQVSPSQVASVRCIFEKTPDFASKVRSESDNQHLKSSYMNALLGLIETLCKLPEKLSDDAFDEASAAVSYLMQVGFKVDWLEKKLEEVKEKKKKMDTGKAQLQHREEELQNLTKKCSDLKDIVEKQSADMSAANVALSFDDVLKHCTETSIWFDQYAPGWGLSGMLPFAKLHDKDGGFLVNDELKIVAEIEALEVIGTLDESKEKTSSSSVKENMDVNGFQSSLIALSYLNNAGFKVDWLEKNLDQVKEQEEKVFSVQESPP